MSGDLLILSALRERGKYNSLISAVPADMLGQDAQFVLNWYKNYWIAYPEHKTLDPDALIALIKLRSGYDKDAMQVATFQVNRLKEKFDQDALDGVTTQLQELAFSGKVGKLITQFNAGEELDIMYEVQRLASDSMRQANRSQPSDWITEDIQDILEREGRDNGFKFPTTVLQRHVKGFLGGTNIAIAAPVDAGKTSFLARSVVGFAQQLEQHYEADRPILWLNNEGPGERIKSRLYTAALEMTPTELIKMGPKIHDAYNKVVGRWDRVRVKDIHGLGLAQVSRIIEQTKPCIVIFDMIANVKVAGSTGNKTEDIEAKLQEVREMAVTMDFAAISTMQVSYEGTDQLYPPQTALKDTKIGAQGALDLLIMMGKLNAADMWQLRGLSTPKNKLTLPGMKGYAQGEVVFDAEKVLFNDGGM